MLHLLLANDDGIDAPGMTALIEALAPLARLTVVAPQSERSATGHAIWVHRPATFTPRPERVPGGKAYSLDANPADCVKFALSMLIPDDLPAAVISGINRGQNTGNNVVYSGTVAAALEGAMYDLPSIAISLAAKFGDEADFSVAQEFIRHLAPQVAAKGLPRGLTLNVNVPNIPRDEIAGVNWARQGHARYTDHWVMLPEDNPPNAGRNGSRIYRNVGETMSLSRDERDDDHMIARGFITVSPLSYNLTHAETLADPPDFDLSL